MLRNRQDIRGRHDSAIDDTSKASAADEHERGPGGFCQGRVGAAARGANQTSRADYQDHVFLGVASGLVPGPGIDLPRLWHQLTMLARMAKLYGIRSAANSPRSLPVLFRYLGGVGARRIAAFELIKAIPVFGTALVLSDERLDRAFNLRGWQGIPGAFRVRGTFVDLDRAHMAPIFATCSAARTSPRARKRIAGLLCYSAIRRRPAIRLSCARRCPCRAGTCRENRCQLRADRGRQTCPLTRNAPGNTFANRVGKCADRAAHPTNQALFRKTGSP